MPRLRFLEFNASYRDLLGSLSWRSRGKICHSVSTLHTGTCWDLCHGDREGRSATRYQRFIPGLVGISVMEIAREDRAWTTAEEPQKTNTISIIYFYFSRFSYLMSQLLGECWRVMRSSPVIEAWTILDDWGRAQPGIEISLDSHRWLRSGSVRDKWA
jgi:hypothetical protein